MILALALSLALFPSTPAPSTRAGAPADPGARRAPDAPWLRVVEERDGELLRLEACVRAYARGGEDGASSPRVFLVAATHVAEPAFYQALQRVLDARDVVLFEGVGAGASRTDQPGAPPAEAARAAATERRLRRLAIAIERQRRERGALPDQLAPLAEGRARELLLDAWGRPLVYSPAADGASFELASLGRDGASGGAGVDRDHAFSAGPPLTPHELGEESGLQQTLARSLGLIFQLDAIDYGGAQWRNSDLGLADVERRMRDAGGDAAALVGALDGSSLLARLGGSLLGWVGSTREGSAMLSIVLLEVLSSAEELLAAAPAPLGALLEVLIEERNDVVLRDLRAILADEPEVESVGIFYGGGHMRDLARRIELGLGFRATGEVWISALTVDVPATGLSPARARSVRRMIQRELGRR